MGNLKPSNPHLQVNRRHLQLGGVVGQLSWHRRQALFATIDNTVGTPTRMRTLTARSTLHGRVLCEACGELEEEDKKKVLMFRFDVQQENKDMTCGTKYHIYCPAITTKFNFKYQLFSQTESEGEKNAVQ
jgi:hypothetical protein